MILFWYNINSVIGHRNPNPDLRIIAHLIHRLPTAIGHKLVIASCDDVAAANSRQLINRILILAHKLIHDFGLGNIQCLWVKCQDLIADLDIGDLELAPIRHPHRLVDTETLIR